MKIAVISSKKTENLEELLNAFAEEKLQAAFLKIDKLSLFTQGNETEIVSGKIDFDQFEAVYLNVGPAFTQFVEPFLDAMVSKGIYCQMKPESFYIISNTPFQYASLNGKGIKIAKTLIFSDPAAVESMAKDFKYPLIFKTFVGHEKTQSLVIENARHLKNMAKSIRAEVNALTVQEYYEGDLYYVAVIGQETFAIKKKWSKSKFEHEEKPIPAAISDEDAKMAVRAARTTGTDMATVKIIDGKVLTVRPRIDFKRFNNVLGKDLAKAVAKHYREVLEK